MSTTVKSDKVPNPSPVLVYLSLLFVPGVYILLLGCAVAMLAGTGFLGYLVFTWMSEGHRVPVKVIGIVFLLLFGALMGCWSVIKGVAATLWSKPDFQPALKIPLNREPDLGKFIAGLCSAIGTSLPNHVIIHAEPTFYVCQTKMQVLNGVIKGRILAIGLPLVAGLKITELRSILAHEFAHFSGGDTLFSTRVAPVYQGAITAYSSMSECIAGSESTSEALPMMVPRFLLGIYLDLFHFINMKLSRVRELRADMVAVLTCGSECFKQALMKTAGLIPTFWDESAKQIVKESDTAENESYYTSFRKALPKLTNMAVDYYKQCLLETENKYDSHPLLKVRLESAPDVPEKYNDKGSAKNLLAHLDEYEIELGKLLATSTPPTRTM